MPVEKNHEKIESERAWYILSTGKETIAILNIYAAAEITANQEYREWNEKLYDLITKEIIQLKAEGHIIIIQGDLNGHVGSNFKNVLKNNSQKVNHNGRLIMALMEGQKMRCHNDEEVNGEWATWTGKRNDREIRSCIDYCLSSGLSRYKTEFRIKKELETGLESDHDLIELKIQVNGIKRKTMKWKKPQYSLGSNPNYEAYKEHAWENLQTISLEAFEKMKQKEQIQHIEASLLKAAKHTFPPKEKKNRRKVAGLPETVRTKIKEKKQLYKKIKQKKGTEDDIKKYKIMKEDIKREVTTERSKLKKHTVMNLYTKDPSMSQFWELLNNKSEQGLKIEALKDKDGKLVYETEKLKSVVYEAFKERLGGSDTEPNLCHTETYKNDRYEEEMMYKATFKEVADVISSFKNKKAMGPHLLRFELIKNLSQSAMGYLVCWINKVIQEARIDDYLNTGTVKLLFKGKGESTEPTNYRPITISPILSKLATKLINVRLTTLVEKNQLLNECQIGFRKEKSCRDGVFILSTMIEKIKQTNAPAVLSFIDLKVITTNLE